MTFYRHAAILSDAWIYIRLLIKAFDHTTVKVKGLQMAYTNIAVQSITKSGLAPTYTAATAVDGNMFTNTGKEFIHVVNADAGAINVTIPTPATVAGLSIEDKVVAVPGNTDMMIGPFEAGFFNQPAGGTDAGKVYVQYSAVVNVTVAALRA